MHGAWQTMWFCQGNGLCLLFCATLKGIRYRELAVKEDDSERREETRCKDLSGSREALPGLEMLHGALRGCGSPQAHPGGRSHTPGSCRLCRILRGHPWVASAQGSSCHLPFQSPFTSCFLPLNTQEDFNQPKSKFVKPLFLKLLSGMYLP